LQTALRFIRCNAV